MRTDWLNARAPLLLAGLLLAVVAHADNTDAPESGSEVVRLTSHVTEFVELHHVDVHQAAQVARVATGVRVAADRPLGVVAVTGPAEQVDEAKAFLKNLDTPSAEPEPGEPELQAEPAERRNIELTIHLLFAMAEDNDESLPAELEPVAETLSRLFPYPAYRYADTIFIRGRHGQTMRTNGALRGAGANRRGDYSLSTGVTLSEPRAGERRSIRLDQFRFGVSVTEVPEPEPPSPRPSRPTPVPASPEQHDVGISTEMEIIEGRNTVVGKTSLGGEEALFVVVSARVQQ